MGQYAAQHATALAKVRGANRTVVTATLEHPGTEQADGSFVGEATTTVTGYAIEDGGDPKEYERLGLTQHEAPRLFFVASTYGDELSPGMKVLWAGAKHTVRSVKAFRPDGVAIFMYAIVSR